MAILDADKEGYLRSDTSLIQTAGRAARNVNGEVVMYADRVTESMAATIRELLQTIYERDYYTVEVDKPAVETFESPEALSQRIAELEARMKEAARRLDFEQAAELRDRVKALRKQSLR